MLTGECICALQSGERGTIKPKANFDAEQDAAALKKALEGLGTNAHSHVSVISKYYQYIFDKVNFTN